MKKSIIAIALVASFITSLTSCVVRERREGYYHRGYNHGYYNNGGYRRGW